MRLLSVCLLLVLLVACAPATPSLQLPTDCRAVAERERLLSASWLEQPGAWRLRQSALLEWGLKSFPMEGFLRLDLKRREARLIALNEMGLVLFDLQVTEDGEQLHRAIPQIKKITGFATGVAQSLRRIFLLPRPELDDSLQQDVSTQRIWRQLPGGSLGFLFDCHGMLRETRMRTDEENWRVAYDQYQVYATNQLPERIVLNDYRRAFKLSLWIREAKLEP